MMEFEARGPAMAWSRRGLVGGAAATLFAARAMAAGGHEGASVTPAQAMGRLASGNARYVGAHFAHPDVGAARRTALVSGQHPFATILACADSRVDPEVIFDQGLGELFVVRVAGNVVDDVVLGSIEYAVIHLGTPLVMVLGHEHCGAVTAAVEALAGKSNKEDQGSKIGALAGLIAPAVRATPASAPDKVEAAVLLNARNAARMIATASPPIREHVKEGKLTIVSARYGLASGKVTDVLAEKIA